MFKIEPEAPRKLHGIEPPTGPVEIKIVSSDEEELVFDLYNAEASFANALRRIMLSEVPTVAIETVNIYMNRGVMQDEILAHRLGLIPVNIDPQSLSDIEEVKFKLHVLNEGPEDRKVYSRDLILVSDQTIEKPLVHDDILITILVPGEEIEVECICAVGTGADHSKFSPVSTASYRTLPVVKVLDETDKSLVSICPVGVFSEIEDLVVADKPRKCTFCRECLRSEVENGKAKVSLKRLGSYFIFQVETVGVLKPEDIFRRAIAILKEKCLVVSQHF